MERSDGGSCTGTLIASNRVLTAAHCVHTVAGVIPAADLRFAAGRRYDQAAAVVQVAEVHVPPSYRYDPRPDQVADLASDVAMLELRRPLDIAPLSVILDSGRRAFDSIGYAAPFEEEPRKQHACTRVAQEWPTGVWGTTCFAFAGASGAPLLTVDGPVALIGMIVARHKRTSVALSAARISELLDVPTGASSQPVD